MNINIPLSPQMAQFVREQLASGCFATEGDVIRAALCLLEDQSHFRAPSTALEEQSRTPGTTTGPSLRRNRACFGEPFPGYTPSNAPVKRSPRGLLSDLRSYISLEDIKETRAELWAAFPHNGA